MPAIHPNPLLELHRQAQAEFQPYGEVEIVSTFGEPQAEYAAIRKAAALIDQPQRAVVELIGRDRLPFLNSLISNQVVDRQSKAAVSPGSVVYAFLLNAKSGRIEADMHVVEPPGERTLLILDTRLVGHVLKSFARYRFAEKVEFHDRSETLHCMALHGPGAAELIAGAVDAPIDFDDESKRCWSARVAGSDVLVWRDDPCGVPGYHLIVETPSARTLWMHLLTRFGTAAADPGKRPLRQAGWAAFNATRIEAGRALFGVDFDDATVPHETGGLTLARAVSFTKGCYPGQEIVARMQARQQLARQLAGVEMRGDALPMAGAQVMDPAGSPIGTITSSTVSPVLSNRPVCLAMLKRPWFQPGTELSIPAEGEMRTGVVVELPFVRP